MSANLLVSVMISTYNRAHLLPRAINSVLNQTYQNFELIIVDDGSTDNTKQVVKSFEDKRIVYHKHKDNRGVLAAKNTGFDLAKGEYNCRLDDDDELLPKALEIAVNKLLELSSQGVKGVWFDAIDAETGRFSGSRIRKEGYIFYEDILCGRVHGDFWGMMHKDYIDDNRFDERLWAGEGILWLKLHRKHKGYYVPKILQRKYREHGGKRVSTSMHSLKHISRIVLTQKTFLQEYGKEMKSLCPGCYGQALAQLGYLEILNNEKSAGRKVLHESFKYSFSLRYFILYLLSFIFNRNQILSLYTVYTGFLNVKGVVASPLASIRKLLLSRTKAS